MNSILRTEKLGKSYALPKGEYQVFAGIDFDLKAGGLAAIMGVSGVGKTTFLNLLGALDKPSSGKIFFNGDDLASKTAKDLSWLRNQKIGFIFQFYHLLPEFTAVENVSIPLLIRGMSKAEASIKAREMLKEVSLEDKWHSLPAQMSGGEQQRVAIARALVTDPKILLADEPTGNLDWKAGELILKLILDLHAKKGLSSIIVTHNDKIAAYCEDVYVMAAGEMKRFSSQAR